MKKKGPRLRSLPSFYSSSSSMRESCRASVKMSKATCSMGVRGLFGDFAVFFAQFVETVRIGGDQAFHFQHDGIVGGDDVVIAVFAAPFVVAASATAFFLIAFVGVIFINLCFIGIDGVDDLLLGQSGKFRFDYNGLHTISLDGGGRRRWCCFCLHARPDLSRRNFFGTCAELSGEFRSLGFITQRDNIPLPLRFPAFFPILRASSRKCAMISTEKSTVKRRT